MIKFLLHISLIVSLFSVSLQASETTKETTDSVTSEQEEFHADKMIFEHILDAYEWHITTIGETHISIPLPVIVYSKHSGLHVFSSSRFHHGEESYNGFEIAEEGPYEGKVVELLPDGSIERPIDISITKDVLAVFFSMFLMLWIFITASKRYKDAPDKAPSGIQSWVEPIIVFVKDDIVKSSIGEKRYEKYLPFLLTIFFFIWINNLLGLIPLFPGGANITGNITITMALALFTFVITTFSGNKHYWKEIFNPEVPWWLKFPIPLMPLVEFMGVFIKPFVLMVRLFANISAGHIVALGFYSLIFVFGHMNVGAGYGASVLSVAFTIFMGLLELLVAFIQAYVFTLLSALYFGMATEEHH